MLGPDIASDPFVYNPAQRRALINAVFCFLGNTAISASYTSSRYMIRMNPCLHFSEFILLYGFRESNMGDGP